MLDTHAGAAATLTIVTTELPAGDDPSRFAWVSVEDGFVTAFEYKPDEPTGDRVCTEVFVFDGPEPLLASPRSRTRNRPATTGTGWYPSVIADGRVVEHRLGGYWRDVGTINSYHRAHMELVGEHPPLHLDDPGWPLLTGSIVGGPARIGPGAEAVSSLLSPGVVVDGVVESSVLGRNVVVEAGAVVRASVVLDDAVIRAGAVVQTAIVDVGITVDAHDQGRPDDSNVTLFTHGGPASDE